MANILIVDDSSVDRHLFDGLLSKSEQFTIIQAENGSQALDKIVEWNVDIVITDLQMPEMDGLQLVKAIRERYPDIPSILVTGFGSEEIATKALKAGAASYVPKSHAAELLVPTVHGVWDILAANRTYGKLLPQATEAKFEFLLDPDVELFGAVNDLIEKMLTGTSPLDRTDRLRVILAVEHALNNALYRGNLEIGPSHAIPIGNDVATDELTELIAERKQKFGSRKIYLCVKFEKSQMVCLIRDQGPGFDTSLEAEISETGGRGLVLMQTFMDSVKFSKSGNEVLMHRRWGAKSSAVEEEVEESTTTVDDEIELLAPVEDNKMNLGTLVSPNGQVVELLRPNLLIGSQETCHLVIKSSEIAPHHCQLNFRDGYWYFKSLRQDKMVPVNGTQSPGGRLLPGDRIRIGRQEFTINYKKAAAG